MTTKSKAWMDDAACKDTDPEVFYPQYGYEVDLRAAIEICKTCTVQPECLELAHRTDARGGVWGGKIFLINRPFKKWKPTT